MQAIEFGSRNEINKKITIDQLNEFYKFLQGEVPLCMQVKPSPKLSSRRAFDIIYFLQERLFVFPDNIECCCVCGDLYDSDCGGFRIRYRNYCDICGDGVY